MLFYRYHPVTKEYLGPVQEYPDPRTGGHTAPANATHVDPPAVARRQVAIFDEVQGKWSVAADFRGVLFWDITSGEQLAITQIGVTPDADMTETAPAAPVKTEAELAREALARSDSMDMARVSEDLIDTLVAKGVIAMADLPQAAQDKLIARKAERAKLAPQLTGDAS
ncbi:hypothetical protein [Fundidesulfovibrio putealis]|uniref:hypothetical protein n=1 Tax=Fundidesulfovibrio putealis TaxID=270496 RepID=UPI000421EA3B|nr:hypothetical protein [Fundidesulfovibrio putealis]